MSELIDIARTWQELIGAVIGAIAALGVALLVAYGARRREDISAAMVVVSNLSSLIIAEATISKIAQEEHTEEENYPLFVASRLTNTCPILSPLFASCVARIMPINSSMAAHLELVSVIYYNNIQQHSAQLRTDIAFYRQHGKHLRPENDMRADAALLSTGLTMIGKHAKCAEKLVSNLVLSNWPIYHRIRSYFFPSAEDKESDALLNGVHQSTN